MSTNAFRLPQRLMALFGRRAADPVPMTIPAAEQPTAADSHLVMNAFSQVAADLRADQPMPALFLAADYLRLVFNAGLDARISLEEEAALLESYVALLAHSRRMAHTVTTAHLEECRDWNVQRHLTCDLVAAAVRSFSRTVVEGAQLAVGLTAAKEEFAYELTIELPQSEGGSAAVERIERELEIVLHNFDLDQQDAASVHCAVRANSVVCTVLLQARSALRAA